MIPHPVDCGKNPQCSFLRRHAAQFNKLVHELVALRSD